MPGRIYSVANTNYRYGFNRQEKSIEVELNSFSAQFWEYDSRIIRRWNIDPKQKVGESPYLCFSGNPVSTSDPNGDEASQQGKKKKTNQTQQKAKGAQSAASTTPTTTSVVTTETVLDYSYSKLDDGWKETTWGGQSLLEKEKCLNQYAGTDPPTNTCAVRFSYASNEAGYPIPTSSPGVRITLGQKGDNGNYILGSQDAKKYLENKAAPTITMLHIKTKDDVDLLIKTIHATNDDFKGILVIRAGNTGKDGYDATGHVELIYKDFMSDISMTAESGDDLGPYLKKESHLKSDLSVYIWQIKN